jgi:RNA polymerase sigma-70 factor, ECF subfamily
MFSPSAPTNAGGSNDFAEGRSTSSPTTFEAIYHHYFTAVCSWIRAMGGPDADRDDIAQEVFLVVRRRLPAFDGANLPGWLYRIAQHQVRDFRRRAWFKHVFTGWRVDEADSLPHTQPTPAAALEKKEDQRALYALLDKIPESRRATFVLFEIEGLSGEEIAQLQGIPLNTVWTRLHHARRDFFAMAAKQHRAEVWVTPATATEIDSKGKRRP